MKQLLKVAPVACALALSVALAGCGGVSASVEKANGDEEAVTLTLYSQAPAEGGNGIIVSAQNSTDSTPTTTEGALTLKAGEGIAIKPQLESGAIHVTITPSGSADAVFDADVEGTKELAVEAGEGSYDVATTPSGATGELTIVPQGA